MKTATNDLLLKFVVLWAVVGLISFSSDASAGPSSEDDHQSPIEESQNLRISADNLVANQNHQHVIFSGHVVARYDLKTITCNELHVFYKKHDGNGKDDHVNHSTIETNIKKIVASGTVKIEFADKIAECDRAVYYAETNVMVLTGNTVRLQSEGNYITGSKITLSQDTGQIIVDGNAEKRVNAVFQPNPKKMTIDPK